ncbi:hypothetical protein [Roseibium sp.]|uniref:hypothetical protein n=1 Tax=Roseibium sp. TaxID=1936156 RepID=UPI003BAAA4E3
MTGESFLRFHFDGWLEINGFSVPSLQGWYIDTESTLQIKIDDDVFICTRHEREDVASYLAAFTKTNHRNTNYGWKVEIPSKYLKRDILFLSIYSGSQLIHEGEVEIPLGIRNHHLSVQQQSLTTTNGKTAAVVCWDLAHNPAGRALVLVRLLQELGYEVDLIGPLHPRFGQHVWRPIADEKNLNIITTVCSNYNDLKRFSKYVADKTYNLLWICKPRFPSIYIGCKIIESSMCQVILDIDDYELSFFSNRSKHKTLSDPLDAIRSNIVNYIDIDATLFAHSTIKYFMNITVSNVKLQNIFGGTIIRHARHLPVIEQDSIDQRKLLGIEGDNIVIGFVGTIREHKGILQLANAIKNSPQLTLMCAGVYEPPEIKDVIRNILGDQVIIKNGVPFSEVPTTLAPVDCVCLLQDFGSETAQYQFPAKISDSLSVGIPVILPNLPPFEDLHGLDGFYFIDDYSDIDLQIIDFVNSADSKNCSNTFQSLFSIPVNAMKLNSIVEKNSQHVDYQELLSFVLEEEKQFNLCNFSIKNSVSKRNLVIFWKQNDAGIFGRRIDMLAKYFISGNVYNRVLIVEPPFQQGWFDLIQQPNPGRGLYSDRVLARAIARKQLDQVGNQGISYLSSMISNSPLDSYVFPVLEPHRWEQFYHDSLIDFSNDEITDFMICPEVEYCQNIVNSLPRRYLIVDFIDDQRNFRNSHDTMQRIHRHYKWCAQNGDLFVTNNNEMSKRFSTEFNIPINIIPNGAELLNHDSQHFCITIDGIPKEKTIIGYIGNMRDRFDPAIVREIAASSAAKAHDWHIVLIGPSGGNQEVEHLINSPRVSMLGAVDYYTGSRLISCFDVAIVPHIVDPLSLSMDPLKIYQLRQSGIPTVMSNVTSSIGSDPGVIVANTARDFISGILRFTFGKKSVEKIRVFSVNDDQNCWSKRIAEYESLIQSIDRIH